MIVGRHLAYLNTKAEANSILGKQSLLGTNGLPKQEDGKNRVLTTPKQPRRACSPGKLPNRKPQKNLTSGKPPKENLSGLDNEESLFPEAAVPFQGLTSSPQV